MKKLILFLIIAIAAAVYFLPAPLLKYGIEAGTKQAFGTDTEVRAVEVDLLAERMDVLGFAVNNPIGFETERFMQLDKGHALVDLKSLLEEVVEVREISVTGMNLHLEQHGSRVNFEAMLEEMAKRERRRETGHEQDSGESDSSLLARLHLPDLHQTRFIVRNLEIGAGKVHVKTDTGEAQSKPLPALSLADVGAESGGVTLAQLSTIVTRALVQSASSGARFDALNADMARQTNKLLDQLETSTASAWEQAGAYWQPIGESMRETFGSWKRDLGDKLNDLKAQAMQAGDKPLQPEPAPVEPQAVPQPQVEEPIAPEQAPPSVAQPVEQLAPEQVPPSVAQPVEQPTETPPAPASMPLAEQTQQFRPQTPRPASAPVTTRAESAPPQFRPRSEPTPAPAAAPTAQAPAYGQPWGYQPQRYGQGPAYPRAPAQRYPQYQGYPAVQGYPPQ